MMIVSRWLPAACGLIFVGVVWSLTRPGQALEGEVDGPTPTPSVTGTPAPTPTNTGPFPSTRTPTWTATAAQTLPPTEARAETTTSSGDSGNAVSVLGDAGRALSAVSAQLPVVRFGLLRRLHGGNVRLPIYLRTAKPFLSLDLRLTYDPTRLQPTAVRPGSIAAGALMAFNANPPGNLAISLATLHAIDGRAGAVLELDFEVVKEVSPRRPLHAVTVAVDR